MTETCPECSRVFDTIRGLDTHIGKMHDPLPREKLVNLYIHENLSAKQIADRLDMTHRSVKNRLSKYDLWGKDPVKHHLVTTIGYPVISHTGVGGRGRRVRVHRLLAIAVGADPYDIFSGEYDVHHINEVKFDNRPDNIEVVRHDEHPKIHHTPEN